MVTPAVRAIVLVRFPFSDLEVGSLHVDSFVRPGKLFTASVSLMVAQVGHLKSDVFNLVLDNLMGIFRPDMSP